MYNLIVSGLPGTWDERSFAIETARFLEHTDQSLQTRFQNLTEGVIGELTRLPTVFAYELGVKQLAHVGWIKTIRVRQNEIRIAFALDGTIAPFSSDKLNKYSWDFDINKNEMHRTHWAIKDVNLLEALRETGLATLSDEASRPLNISRKTIIEAAASLKNLGHADLDRLLLEFGINDLKAGRELGGRQSRTNALAEFAGQNPTATTAEGEPVGAAIVKRAAAAHEKQIGYFGTDELEESPFLSSLRRDGYDVVAGKLIVVRDETAPQPPYAQSSTVEEKRGDETTRFNRTPTKPVVPTEQPTSEYVIRPTVFSVPRSEMATDLVAVMMPFETAFEAVFQAIKDACQLASFDCRRVKDVWNDSVIMQDVFSLIYTSRIVIVDFSEKNPNVFYETGIAHTLGKPVIPITQHDNDVPFDLRHHRYLHYLNNGEGLQNLTQKLASRLKTIGSEAESRSSRINP
jgi:hypothetical protein